MKQDLTDIVVVVDRSGSMISCRDDAQGGINTFIEEQKKLPGDARLTLVEFDDIYDFVHRAVPIKDVPPYTLIPRGSTALLDAVGKAIAETGERLKNTPEDERPGLVVCVIVTDGGENASKEYKKSQVKAMIEEQQSKYKWQFTFLGANQDAFAEGGGIGINLAGVANYTPQNTDKAFACASSNVGRMRGMAIQGLAAASFYTPEEVLCMVSGNESDAGRAVEERR